MLFLKKYSNYFICFSFALVFLKVFVGFFLFVSLFCFECFLGELRNLIKPKYISPAYGKQIIVVYRPSLCASKS